MLKAEKSTAQNIFHLVRFNIQEEYSNLLEDKLHSVQSRKSQLKKFSEVVLAGFKELAASPSHSTPQDVLPWIQSIDGKFVKIFIAGPDNKVIYYNDPNIIGKSIANIKDIKGRTVQDIIDSPALLSSGHYAVFSWNNKEISQKSKQLGYLTSFHPWGWTVGTLIDISDIEAEAHQKVKDLISSLSHTFRKIHIAKSGGLFLFNTKAQLLIPPPSDAVSAKLLKPQVLKELMPFAKSQPPQRITLGHRQIALHTAFFKSLGWYVAALVPVKEIQEPANALIIRQSMIICAIFLIGLTFAVIFVGRISKPLQLLTAYVKKVPAQDFTKREQQDPTIVSLANRHKDEVGALAEAFSFMHSELRDNIQKLMATTATKERIQGELNVARDIQLGILPKIFPAFPGRDDFDLYAFIEPAKEVGGDFYDFYLLDNNRLCFTIGDVSDKGAPAALFMAITKTLIKTYSETERSPARIMEKVNNDLGQDNPNCMFVTLFTAILDISTGHVTYVNAGHNPPIVLSKDGPYFLKELSGPVAGAMEGMEYKELHIHLRHDEGILLYTDGVTEAMDIDKQLYSEDRLLNTISNSESLDAQETIEIVKNDVKAFTGNASQSDDITMFMLRLGSKTI